MNRSSIALVVLSVLATGACTGSLSEQRGRQVGNPDTASPDGASPDAGGATDGGPPTDGACTSEGCPGLEEAVLAQELAAVWEEAKTSLTQSTTVEAIQANPYVLYNVQLYTANLLLYAEAHRDAALLEELATLYGRAFPALQLQQEAVFYYARNESGGRPRTQVLPLATPARMWTGAAAAGDSVGPEFVLVSSQFLYAVARLTRIISEMDTPSATLLAFVDEAVPVLVTEHYLRWIDKGDPEAPGIWQVAGWGCNYGTFDHHEYAQNLLLRRHGTDHFSRFGRVTSLTYCNAVLDIDLWIFSGIAELLAAHHADPSRVSIEDGARHQLLAHARLGVQLVESRHETVPIAGQSTMGAVFDPGSFDGHPDMRYAGFDETQPECLDCTTRCPATCSVFPGWKDAEDRTPRVAPPDPPIGIGWDLSHARRLPLVYDTLWRHRAVLGTTFPTQEHITQFARQLAFNVFNGDFEAPSFATYFDGSAGWFRVNYSNKEAHGLAPQYMTQYVNGCGFGFWAPLEPALGLALEAVRPQGPDNGWPGAILSLPEQTQASLF